MIRGCTLLSALVATQLACGSDGGAPDATDGGCWSLDGSTSTGVIELGTGEDAFEPLGDTLQFQRGNQGGTYLVVNARIKGLEPGDPLDIYAPGNPRTKFAALLWDGDVVGPRCPARAGYEPSQGGYFERVEANMIEFLPFARGEKAFGSYVTIVVEIIDSALHYARDERMVYAAPPPPLPDAAPPDAGPPEDASTGD